MSVRTNKAVACTPLPKHSVDTQSTQSGFQYAAPRTNLAKVKALAYWEGDHFSINKGDDVFIPLDFANQSWATRVLSCADIGDAFIMVPPEHIVAVRTP